MVIVTNEPYESEPMLPNAKPSSTSRDFRKNSYEEAYGNIASSMNADQLQIEDFTLALKLLSTAINLKNMPLVKQCIEILDTKLSKFNVLAIYSHLSHCKMPSPTTNTFEPSAPPIVERENQRDTNWVEELTDNLRFNCLIEIDRNAAYVLKQDDILSLPYTDLLAILTRDTLEIRDESIVYSVVLKWATVECQRRGLNPHMVNIKAVIRDLRYCPRYGLLSRKELRSRVMHGEKGPTKSGVLEEHEWRKIQFYIKEKSKGRPVEELAYKMSQKREAGSDKPKLLSAQSSLRAARRSSSDDGNVMNKRKLSGNCTSGNSNGGNNCEKFLLNFLTCWAAIFD